MSRNIGIKSSWPCFNLCFFNSVGLLLCLQRDSIFWRTRSPMGSVCEGEGSARAWLRFDSLSDTHTTLCP